jgi:phosphoglycerate dehydrogenase-like enzyme
MKPNVVVTSYYDPAVTDKPLSRLAGRTCVQRVQIEPFSDAKLHDALRDSAIAIISGERFDNATFNALPDLRLLCCDGTGTDHIDLAAATKRGVIVTNAPVVHEACADLAMGLILAGVRGIVSADRSVRGGSWNDRSRYVSSDLSGSVLGLLGLGHVAQALAHRAAAFNMKVIGYSPRAEKTALLRFGIELVSPEELWARADVLSIHVRLSEVNHGIVGAREFGQMKNGAYLVNTSRGGVIDEAAFVAALESGKLRGAALDVLTEEPPPMNHPLFRFSNVIITPHIASDTQETFAKVLNCVVDDILLYLAGKVPNNVVNRDVLSCCSSLTGVAHA